MAQSQPFPLPISYGHTDQVKNSGGYLINLEAEVAPPDARSPVTIRGTPGLSTFWDTGDFPVVALIENDGACYIITKNALYRGFEDGGTFKLATFALQSLANASTNGIDIVATDGFRIWAYTIRSDEQSKYDTSAPFVDYAVELTNEPNWYPASSITFLDGYFILNRDGSNQFYNTGLYSLTVNVAAFSAAETNPDDVVAVYVDHQGLEIFGTKSVEFWYDAGVGESPFQRVSGGLSEHGAASPWCIAKINNNTFTVSPEATVYAYQGYQPRPISTPAIEDALKMQDLTTATAFCYSDGGHFYYQLTAGTFTAVYDMSTQLWHVREDAEYGRHRASCHAFAFGRNLVGDFNSGKVYHYSTEYTDNAGDPLIAKMVSGPLPTGGQPVGVSQIGLDTAVGFGNADCPNPVIGLEMSRDDGLTWGNQRTQSLGALGKYKRRVTWNKCGSAYDPRFRFTLSDPVKRSFSSRAWIETA